MPAQSAVDVSSHICTFGDLRLLQGKANTHRLRGRAVCVCVCVSFLRSSVTLILSDSKKYSKQERKEREWIKRNSKDDGSLEKKIIFRFSPNERLV